MIKNDKQYQVTRARLKDFDESLKALEDQGMEPLLKELHTGAIQSQIVEFKKELNDYEALKNGEVESVFIHSLSEISDALIKARIIKGWSQADLAKRLELKEQQIQRYESCDYATANMTRISEVASVLNIGLSQIKVKVKEPEFELPSGWDID